MHVEGGTDCCAHVSSCFSAHSQLCVVLAQRADCMMLAVACRLLLLPGPAVCMDAPPAMADIDWAGCAGVTRYGRRCAGKCLNGKNGSPSIACLGGAWSLDTMIGKCVTGPICTAPFPSLANGVWPNSCADSASGSTCIAVCNNGYSTPGASTTCTSTGWAPVVGKCGRNP